MVDWQPIETAPTGEAILCYAPYSPNFFVGTFDWRVEQEEVLVSERGNSKTYEVVETRERDWGASDSWGATHWAPLPDPPVEDE